MQLRAIAIVTLSVRVLAVLGQSAQGQPCSGSRQTACQAGLGCAYAIQAFGGSTPICVPLVTTVGGNCDTGPNALCGTTASGQQLYPFLPDGFGFNPNAHCACVVSVGEGQACRNFQAPCASPFVCAYGTCVAKVDTVGESCDANPQLCGADPTVGTLYCQAGANGDTCQPVGTTGGANCAGDLSGNSCASPYYCTGPNAPATSANQCQTKMPLGLSCAFDPVNGCTSGSYCTSTDQTCQGISLQVGGTCGRDSNACSASAGLYCIAATQLCGRKATTIGASCAFDPLNGCSSTNSGQQLYCRPSDQTCQPRLSTIGADCRNDPVTGCSSATAADGTAVPLYCSLPTFQCAAQVGAGASCESDAACLDSRYCSSNNHVCVSRVNSLGGACNDDPYAQCGVDPTRAYTPYLGRPGYDGQLYPGILVNAYGDQNCYCYTLEGVQRLGVRALAPVPGMFGLTAVGDDCSADPSFACGYSATGVKLYCALSTNTCQEHVRTVGGLCAYDYLGACGIIMDDYRTQLYPSIPVGSSGHADCTCVTQADVVVRPSSRARARARSRRNLSLCPGSHTACPVGDGFECIDTENNLEQCGGCSTNGGVDCTALGGVAAVGCVAGRCEIWACEEGFTFDAAEEACFSRAWKGGWVSDVPRPRGLDP